MGGSGAHLRCRSWCMRRCGSRKGPQRWEGTVRAGRCSNYCAGTPPNPNWGWLRRPGRDFDCSACPATVTSVILHSSSPVCQQQFRDSSRRVYNTTVPTACLPHTGLADVWTQALYVCEVNQPQGPCCSSDTPIRVQLQLRSRRADARRRASTGRRWRPGCGPASGSGRPFTCQAAVRWRWLHGLRHHVLFNHARCALASCLWNSSPI